MGKLTSDEVKKIAKLAKLTLTEEEVKTLTPQLAKILDYVNELSKVEIPDDVLPTAQTTGLLNILRKDEIKSIDILNQEDALSNTKNKHNGYFVVPALLDK